MDEPVERERIKGWDTLGERSKNDDLTKMVDAIKAVGEAEVSGATVDDDFVTFGGEHGLAEGIDDTGRRNIAVNAPVGTLIDASLQREDWKAQGAPSKIKLFFAKIFAYVPFLARPFQPRRKAKTRHEYEHRHDGYKRIHKL